MRLVVPCNKVGKKRCMSAPRQLRCLTRLFPHRQEAAPLEVCTPMAVTDSREEKSKWRERRNKGVERRGNGDKKRERRNKGVKRRGNGEKEGIKESREEEMERKKE